MPELHGEAFVSSAEDGHKVVFKNLDCLFFRIPDMVVWWDELILHLIVLNCSLEVCRALVIKDVDCRLLFLKL